MLYQFTLKQTYFGVTEMFNVYHFDNIADDPTAIEVGRALRDGFIANCYGDFPSGVVYNGVARRRMDLPDYPTIFDNDDEGTPGGNAETQALPPTNAVVLSLTGPTQRPNRVRKYISGYVESAQANGLWGVGVLSRINDFATFLINFGFETQLDANLVSFRLTDPTTHDYIANRVYSAQYSAAVATMRSRRIGVGI